MIDRHSRDKIGEAIRALSSGLISNDDFERRVPRSQDAAVSQVFWEGAWMLYSDVPGYRLRGRNRLPAEARREVARWVLFLKTDQAYEWPYLEGFSRALFALGAIVTLGISTRVLRRRWERAGDVSVWPFIDERHFQAALAQPIYLAGRQHAPTE